MSCCKKKIFRVAAHAAKLKEGKQSPPKMAHDKSVTFSRLEDVVELDGYEQDPEDALRFINVMPECCSRSMLHLTGGKYEVVHFCKGSCAHKNMKTVYGTCKDCK